jgi:hypothetical protein
MLREKLSTGWLHSAWSRNASFASAIVGPGKRFGPYDSGALCGQPLCDRIRHNANQKSTGTILQHFHFCMTLLSKIKLWQASFHKMSSISAPSTFSHTNTSTATMPALETMQHDEAFLTLLSSQRELLNQLNMESALRREQTAQTRRPAKPKRGSTLGFDPYSLMNRPLIEKRGSILGSDPTLLLNQPIQERRGSLDMILSNRLSLGMGNDGYMFPSMFTETDVSFQDCASTKERKAEVDFGDAMFRKMKRRRSSMGLSWFLDDSKQVRRLSTASMMSLPKPIYTDEPKCGAQDALSLEQEPSSERFNLDPNLDLATLKDAMQTCADAMAKSAQSQLDIHDWDRKMGLKKSHSKTMRLSSRSRKKLRAAFKKEISTMAASSQSSKLV